MPIVRATPVLHGPLRWYEGGLATGHCTAVAEATRPRLRQRRRLAGVRSHACTHVRWERRSSVGGYRAKDSRNGFWPNVH